MEEEQAKVHTHRRHRRATSSRANRTEQMSPSKPTTIKPIVIVQSNGDEAANSPASSTSVLSKTVEDTNLCASKDDLNETQNNPVTDNVDDRSLLGIKKHTNASARSSPSTKVPTKHPNLDPTASPAQRSIRSRSSNEKSPRQKRSKSESKRRRERKLIAAGEMEVRQANETLMRYLKQCSDTNDVSLSGELEIDKSIDDRFHRRSRLQKDNEGQYSSSSSIGPKDGKSTRAKSINAFSMIGNRAASFARERIPRSGLSTILNELTADIIPNHDEIYNPFTPVVSPTDCPRTDRMFVQTPRGFRSVSDNNFYKNIMDDDAEKNRFSGDSDAVNLSCAFQRSWILLSNICHGLLAGLALAHILFVVTITPKDLLSSAIKSFASSIEIYTNTFYCLSILCLVSIFDRMDICRWNASETISFRWIIVVMIYMATIVLCLSSDSFDERTHLIPNSHHNGSTIEVNGMERSDLLNIWSPLSLAKSIAAIIGWILIGLRPTEDNLYDQLIEMEKYRIRGN